MKTFPLKLWQRVVIVAATSSLPLLAIASYLIDVSVSKDIRFTLQEMRGNAFQRPLERLLDLLPRHQAAVRAARDGDVAAPAAVTNTEIEIDRVFAELAANGGGELARALKTTRAETNPAQDLQNRLSAAATGWRRLKLTETAKAVDDNQTETLVAEIRALIGHAGNASNLILDTDIDSFYLVDITLNALPQTQERLGDITLKVGQWLRQGQVQSRLTQIVVMAALLRREDQDRITRDAEISVTSDGLAHGVSRSLQERLPAAVKGYLAANQDFLDLLNRVGAGGRVTAADFEKAGWNARAESFRLWEISSRELDALLAARVADYRRAKFWDFASMGATLLVTALAVWLVSVEFDITDRKETEARLLRMKNHLANIIDSLPAALVGLDRAGAVTQWNRQAETLTGQPAATALGRAVLAVLPEFAPWITALRDQAKTGSRASLERMYLESLGERQVFDLMLYPLGAGGSEGAVLRIENITERESAQAMMIQSEKMMSLGGLAAGMAHEINNPLGIITQAAQNIERRVSPDLPANQRIAAELGLPLGKMQDYFKRREILIFIQDIRDASSRAAKIIANMLQFSRKGGTERHWASLAELVDRTVELAANDYDLRKQFDFRGIKIVREYQADLPDLPVVVVEIQQVLLNLLKNAAQALAPAASDRVPTITLRLRREERHAVIEVVDNGCGMDEKVSRRVFEPFFTTKPPGVGTGLGLSVSYTIVTQNHQGLLSVESSAGAGSRFTIKLPLHEGTCS